MFLNKYPVNLNDMYDKNLLDNHPDGLGKHIQVIPNAWIDLNTINILTTKLHSLICGMRYQGINYVIRFTSDLTCNKYIFGDFRYNWRNNFYLKEALAALNMDMSLIELFVVFRLPNF